MLRTLTIISSIIISGLAAQGAFGAADYGNKSASFSNYTASHEDQLYAAQVRSSYNPARQAKNETELLEDGLPADILCSIHFNSGFSVSSLRIKSIQDDKLIVLDKSGNLQDIFLKSITKVEIAAGVIAAVRDERGIPESRGWLRSLLSKPRNYIISLGWLSDEEKIELLQSQFLASNDDQFYSYSGK